MLIIYIDFLAGIVIFVMHYSSILKQFASAGVNSMNKVNPCLIPVH